MNNRVLCTMPGLIGDNMFKIPVAYQISKQLGKPVTVYLDEGSAVICSVLRTQDWVEEVKVTHGVTGHPMGGQPWDFGRDAEWKAEFEQVWHLGFRYFPGNNMILETRDQSAFPFHAPELVMSERPLAGEWTGVQRIALAIESSYPPRAEQTLRSIIAVRDELAELVDEVVIIAHKWTSEYEPLLQNPKYKIHNDHGDLNLTVKLLDTSLLIGTYSSMWAMMGACVHGAQIVVVDHGFVHPSKINRPDRERMVLVDDAQTLLLSAEELCNQWKDQKTLKSI